jgi:hypothetical protein
MSHTYERTSETDVDRHVCICVENLDNNSIVRNYWIIKHFFFPENTMREVIEDELREIMYQIGVWGIWERQVYFPPQGVKAVIMDTVP